MFNVGFWLSSIKFKGNYNKYLDWKSFDRDRQGREERKGWRAGKSPGCIETVQLRMRYQLNFRI